jgi:biotin-(acetyl-CoA carboxylase) ligase
MKTKEVLNLLKKAGQNEDIAKILEFVLEQQTEINRLIEEKDLDSILIDKYQAKLAEIKRIVEFTDRQYGITEMEVNQIRKILEDV